jgi:OOP family OmpA-OmpF porin
LAKSVFVLICTLIIYLSVLTPLTALALTVRPKAPPRSELGGLSFTPTIGGYLSTGSGALNSSLLYGAKIGYDKLGTSIVDSLGVEGTLNYLTTTSQSDNSTANCYLFRVDAIYPFLVSKKVLPFLAIGLGGINTNTASHSKFDPLLNYGPGLKYFLEDYLALRVDVRHLLVYSNVNTHNNFEASVGLSYYFGKERKKKPAPLPAPKPPVKEIPKPEIKPADTIPMPVPLSLPTSAETAVPAVSTKIICLEGNVLVQSLTPTTDSSSSQGKAEVTLTPGAMIVVQSGQALPSPVPASPAELQKAREAALVENELQSLRVLTIEFDINRSKVKPKYDRQLKELAALMKASPGSSAIIEGHSDSTGKKNSNIKLSLKRAKSVQGTLMKFGVPPARISTIGYGSSVPIADNSTEQGRQKNRRAVTTVTLLVPSPDTLSAPSMPAAQEVGMLVEIRGKVIIERGRSRLTARNKSKIQAGDIIITAAKSGVKLLLNDQSTLALGGKSRLVVKDFIKRKGTEGSSLNGG